MRHFAIESLREEKQILCQEKVTVVAGALRVG